MTCRELKSTNLGQRSTLVEREGFQKIFAKPKVEEEPG
jgi:hypothetical protein